MDKNGENKPFNSALRWCVDLIAGAAGGRVPVSVARSMKHLPPPGEAENGRALVREA